MTVASAHDRAALSSATRTPAIPPRGTGPTRPGRSPPKGEKQADRLGRFLAGVGFKPDAIITSPKIRAAKTAEIVAEHLGLPFSFDTRIATTSGWRSWSAAPRGRRPAGGGHRRARPRLQRARGDAVAAPRRSRCARARTSRIDASAPARARRRDPALAGPARPAQARPLTARGLYQPAGEGHRAVRPEHERRQLRREVRERQDVVVQLDPERFAHEPAARLDPRPGRRVAAGERGAQRLVGECHAVLDVGREVVGAGGRDHVGLERHPRAELDGRAGRERRVDPFVEADQVPGVEEDPEERIAEPPHDRVVQRAAGLPDAQALVPRGDRLEVRRRRGARRSPRSGPGARSRPRPRSRHGSRAHPTRRTRR